MKLPCLIMFFCSVSLKANIDTQNSWNLNILDQGENLVASAVITLTTIPAHSCLYGSWFKIQIANIEVVENNQFPSEAELSYQLQDGNIVLGRNSRCDSYVHLTGRFSNKLISGVYSAFGLGWSKDLGTFTMSKEG